MAEELVNIRIASEAKNSEGGDSEAFVNITFRIASFQGNREFTVSIRLASSWSSCYIPQKIAQDNRLLRRQRKIMDIISIAGYTYVYLDYDLMLPS